MEHFVYIPVAFTSRDYLRKRDNFFRKAFQAEGVVGNRKFRMIYVVGEWTWRELLGGDDDRGHFLVDIPGDTLSNKGTLSYREGTLEYQGRMYNFLVVSHDEYFFSEGIGAKRKAIIYDGVRRGNDSYFSSFDFNAGGAVRWGKCPRSKVTSFTEVRLSDCVLDNIRIYESRQGDNIAIVANDKKHFGITTPTDCVKRSFSLHKYFTYSKRTWNNILRQIHHIGNGDNISIQHMCYSELFARFGEDLTTYWCLKDNGYLLIRNARFSLDDIRNSKSSGDTIEVDMSEAGPSRGVSRAKSSRGGVRKAKSKSPRSGVSTATTVEEEGRENKYRMNGGMYTLGEIAYTREDYENYKLVHNLPGEMNYPMGFYAIPYIEIIKHFYKRFKIEYLSGHRTPGLEILDENPIPFPSSAKFVSDTEEESNVFSLPSGSYDYPYTSMNLRSIYISRGTGRKDTDYFFIRLYPSPFWMAYYSTIIRNPDIKVLFSYVYESTIGKERGEGFKELEEDYYKRGLTEASLFLKDKGEGTIVELTEHKGEEPSGSKKVTVELPKYRDQPGMINISGGSLKKEVSKNATLRSKYFTEGILVPSGINKYTYQWCVLFWLATLSLKRETIYNMKKEELIVFLSMSKLNRELRRYFGEEENYFGDKDEMEIY